MTKPRIFLGSSGKQEKLLQALTRGLEDVAHVEPWTTSFNPGTTTLERLLELTREVDFAAFVFAQDDWTTNSPLPSTPPGSGQASPRDNVVFEAGLFGGVLGMRRTFILHASGSKLPSDLLGLTSVRYGEATTPAEIRVVNQKLRKAIENEGRVARIEGLWWQFSLTERTAREPSAAEPFEDFAGPRRGAGGGRPFLARGWPPVSEILERSGEGEEGAFGRLLLLEGRTAVGPECAAVVRDGRDPDGVGRARVRVLDDSCGHAPESGRADGRCLLARRSRGHEHPRRRRRSETRGADRRTAEAVEVDQDHLRSPRPRWARRPGRVFALHSRRLSTTSRDGGPMADVPTDGGAA